MSLGFTRGYGQPISAVREGFEIIYQGSFFDGVWGCHPDFLLRVFFFSSRRRHTRLQGDWSSDVCSSDLRGLLGPAGAALQPPDRGLVVPLELVGRRELRVLHEVEVLPAEALRQPVPEALGSDREPGQR